MFSAALALLLVGGVVGAVAATALNPGSQVASSPTNGPTATPAPTPSATAENPITATPLPPVSFRRIGERLLLRPDPTLTWDTLYGALEWVDEHGLDVESLQGFQRADGIQPWTAYKKDGSGMCVLLRTDDGSLFDSMGCGSPGAVTVVRSDGGSTIRFTLNGKDIDAHFVSR